MDSRRYFCAYQDILHFPKFEQRVMTFIKLLVAFSHLGKISTEKTNKKFISHERNLIMRELETLNGKKKSK